MGLGASCLSLRQLPLLVAAPSKLTCGRPLIFFSCVIRAPCTLRIKSRGGADKGMRGVHCVPTTPLSRTLLLIHFYFGLEVQVLIRGSREFSIYLYIFKKCIFCSPVDYFFTSLSFVILVVYFGSLVTPLLKILVNLSNRASSAL